MKIITLTRRQFLSAAGVSVSSWLYFREAQGMQFPNLQPDGGLGTGRRFALSGDFPIRCHVLTR